MSKHNAIIAALCILLGAALWWINRPGETVGVGKTVQAAPAAEIKKAQKVAVDVKAPVKVYSGGAGLKGRIKLPEDVVADGRQQVIASSKIDATDDHPHTVTTVINTETGESETYVRTDPLPWLAWGRRGAIGMYAGIKNGMPTVRLQIRHDLIQIKAIHFGAIAAIDQPISGPMTMDYFAGVGAEYRW